MLDPLYHLLEKEKEWNWKPKCEKALIKCKRLVKSLNVLAHYDPALPVPVACDTSPYGIGAFKSNI